MTAWLVALAFGLAAALAAGAIASGIRIKAGWQNGRGILARHLDERRRARFNAQLPEALATMSNALRAGFSISQAFDSVVSTGEAPVSEEFAILQQQLRIGMSFEEALDSMSKRVGSEDLTLVTTALVISRHTGGNVTEIFDKISETIRGRLKIERKVRTLTAQGRLQGLVVTLMPFFLCIILTIMRPGMMLPFLTSAVGLLTILGTIVLVTLGWLMIRRIIRIDV